MTPILQMRTLRPRKVAGAAPGHKVSERWVLSRWTTREARFEHPLLCPGA